MKLFVVKLNRDAVESDLLEWFGAMGPVKSAKIVMDRDTGQSKCFGFVEMENREGGEKAIAEMNGQEFMGFRMVVKEAEERGHDQVGRLTIGLHHHLSSQAPDLQALRVKEDIKVVLSIARVEILVQTKSPPRKRKRPSKSRTSTRMVQGKQG